GRRRIAPGDPRRLPQPQHRAPEAAARSEDARRSVSHVSAPAPLVPARPAFAADGTPYSETYRDIYHSAQGGPAQVRHVFLGGNGLPERWRGRRTFTVLETGFGFGLSFLATWQAWLEDSQHCERLHFVSIEKHPFDIPDLLLLLERFPELKENANQLAALW